MFRLLSKLFGSPSSRKASRRTYRPAMDVLETRVVPAVDAFIWFEAPGAVPGESNNSHGAGQYPDSKAFEIKFNEFVVKNATDSAAPEFFKNSSAGAHYEKVVLEMRNAGGDPLSTGQPFLQYKFGTVFTTKIAWSGPGDEGPQESITFVYGNVEVHYAPPPP